MEGTHVHITVANSMCVCLKTIPGRAGPVEIGRDTSRFAPDVELKMERLMIVVGCPSLPAVFRPAIFGVGRSYD
jgi:hypothetical protein